MKSIIDKIPLRLKGYLGLFLVCSFYWILDSIWSNLSFEYNLKKLIFSQPASYLDPFLLKVPPYQIVSRLMVVTLFVILGSVILEFFLKRQAAEKERKEAHETLLTVLNSIDATIYVSDMQTNKILFMNQYMIDRFKGNFIGQKCHDVFQNNEEPCVHCPLDRLLDASGNPTGVVVWEARNPVTDTWYVNFDRAVKWMDGRVVHLQIATDITQIKDLQEKQLKAEAQLVQAQKMESIGNLAGGVAHDLNNLLSPIIGYGEMLLEDRGLDDLQKESVSEIVKAGFRARDLVRQLLAFSRKQTLNYIPVSLNKVANGVENLLRRTIRENITLDLCLSPDIQTVMADVGQIEQVIMNLAVNAADAMPDGGRLSIETAPVFLDEEYANTHEDVKPGQYVMLSVSDTGTGIDDVTRAQMFEPFFSTKGEQGTGLGLATVYGIVKQHEGHIWIYSELGKGTTFKVYLPVSEGKAHSRRVRQRKENPRNTKGDPKTSCLWKTTSRSAVLHTPF